VEQAARFAPSAATTFPLIADKPALMPELPEVETTRRGIAPYITGATVTGVVVREPRLRWPVLGRLAENIQGQTIGEVRRRGKYLLLETLKGTAILHLGMSGSLRLIQAATPVGIT